MTRRSKRCILASLCLGLTAVLTVTAAPPEVDAPTPAWIDHPKGDDSIFLYRVGHSEGHRDKAAAQQAAYANALSVILNEMLARSGVDETIRPDLAAALPVQNAEIVPGAVHTETTAAGIACWVQVSYPLTEKARLLDRIEPELQKVLERVAYDKRMAATFSDARKAYGRGDYESALTNLQAVLLGYARLRAPGFEQEDAQILLGDTHGARKDFLAARQCYESVMHNSSSVRWKEAGAARLKGLPKAPRAWPLNDRWQGKKVELLCAMREVGQPPRAFAALGGVLIRDCQEARLPGVDGTADVKPEVIAALFDQQAVAAVSDTAKRRDAGVVLAVLLTTDPAKRGKTQQTMGIEMPVMDSEVAFLVIDAAGGKTRYSDRFTEMAGARSESRLAERIAAILIEKYLVPKCPSLTPP